MIHYVIFLAVVSKAVGVSALLFIIDLHYFLTFSIFATSVTVVIVKLAIEAIIK